MTAVDDVIRRACDPTWQQATDAERLADPSVREDVYRALHPRPAPEHRTRGGRATGARYFGA